MTTMYSLRSPFILSILLITILPIIMVNGFKIPMTLDISQEGERHVRTSLSEGFPGGKNYEIQPGRSGRYFIGDVIDEHQVIIPVDPTVLRRFVLVHPREDGSKYVRVTDRWRNYGHCYRSRIKEFIKMPGYPLYSPVVRVPIEVDVLTQDIDPYINVELLGDWEEHDRRPGVMPVDIEDMPILFTIQPEVALHAMIGIVRYGHYIVDNNVDGLMSRTIIWEGGVENPRLIITSEYSDGRRIEEGYAFSTTNGFDLYHMSNKQLYVHG